MDIMQSERVAGNNRSSGDMILHRLQNGGLKTDSKETQRVTTKEDTGK